MKVGVFDTNGCWHVTLPDVQILDVEWHHEHADVPSVLLTVRRNDCLYLLRLDRTTRPDTIDVVAMHINAPAFWGPALTTPPGPEMVDRARRDVPGDKTWCECSWYDFVDTLCDTHRQIALALTAAHAQGRAEGLEEAATKAETHPFTQGTGIAIELRRAAEEAR